MADVETRLEAWLANLDTGKLVRSCSVKPEIQSCSHNSTRALENMERPDAERGDQLVPSKSWLKSHELRRQLSRGGFAVWCEICDNRCGALSVNSTHT